MERDVKRFEEKDVKRRPKENYQSPEKADEKTENSPRCFATPESFLA
jgi:hypothetical protein